MRQGDSVRLRLPPFLMLQMSVIAEREDGVTATSVQYREAGKRAGLLIEGYPYPLHVLDIALSIS